MLSRSIADADIGSLSLSISFDKYLNHMLVKFEPKKKIVSFEQIVSFLTEKWFTFLAKH